MFFGIESVVKNKLIKYNCYNNYTNISTTFLIGGSSAIIANPLDVIIILKKQNKSISYTFKEEGLKRFYVGPKLFFVRNGVFLLDLLLDIIKLKIVYMVIIVMLKIIYHL
jgi:hypothetical protein